ncbi:sigma-70 family RNA polymerase sigma factor [Polyangium aurulentum]|uniref:sigma-70 family RNA polymerase sigma factor n=1 Tax=Polyangium aurulentum TaxID=2567896 RepID=UPI0010AEE1C4|nr:sigma-70 family RNA polymerase sigma factor [Polyangium aurulentum]UQA59522.1 sigma-70 family RNA polymerase sigma factor [Polyangium aurulentum]
MGITAGRAAAVSTYRSESEKRAQLSPELEQKLTLRWRNGDRDAGQQIIEACLPFVMTIALEYRRWGVPMEDLVQEGNIGLLKAAERFDPARGCRLVTYAAYWIRAEIREYVARGYRIVRLGSSKSERRVLRIYRRTHERDPDVLAQQSGLPRERVVALLPLLMSRDVSLDRMTPEGDAPLDRLASSMPSPEEQACRGDEQEQVSRALRQIVDELSPREQRIAHTRWLTDQPATLEQLGESFGVSKERVRQLEERAKKHVRQRLSELMPRSA